MKEILNAHRANRHAQLLALGYDPENLLTNNQVAELLGEDTAHLNVLRNRGILSGPSVNVGGYLYYTAEDMERIASEYDAWRRRHEYPFNTDTDESESADVDTEPVLSADEVAERFGFTRQRLYQLIDEGAITNPGRGGWTESALTFAMGELHAYRRLRRLARQQPPHEPAAVVIPADSLELGDSQTYVLMADLLAATDTPYLAAKAMIERGDIPKPVAVRLGRRGRPPFAWLSADASVVADAFRDRRRVG